MKIEKVKNENGGTEYHVIDQGIIHASYSLEEAKDYVDFAKNPKEYMRKWSIKERAAS
tara:strand:+ start:294 stop:467 length:174 start_codon:yes stop_codon:yes gene_type:complete